MNSKNQGLWTSTTTMVIYVSSAGNVFDIDMGPYPTEIEPLRCIPRGAHRITFKQASEGGFRAATLKTSIDQIENWERSADAMGAA
jgi:hypothetical protein